MKTNSVWEKIRVGMFTLMIFILSPVNHSIAEIIELPCVFRMDIDNNNNYRLDHARIGRQDGTVISWTTWAEFDITPLKDRIIKGVGFRVYNSWDGNVISALRYTNMQPSLYYYSMNGQNTFARKYQGFNWPINPQGWSPSANDYFRPTSDQWNSWRREGGSGNSVIEDLQAHIDDPSRDWFAVQFSAFNQTNRSCLCFAVNNGGNVYCTGETSVYMEVETEECFEAIKVEDDKYPVGIGETAVLTVDPVMPDTFGIDWAIVKEYPDDKAYPLRYKKTQRGNNKYLVFVEEESGSGWLHVKATSTDDPECYAEAMIYIGCGQCCSGLEGGGFVNLSSIDIGIGLGTIENGRSAGNLFLKSDLPSPELCKPESLVFSGLSSSVNAVYDGQVLRQIDTPGAFVDIVTDGDYAYEIRFYEPEDKGSKTGVFYEVNAGAVPGRVWRIENPDQSGTVYNRLKITETVEGNPGYYQYEYDEAQKRWSLNKGDGLQIETRSEESDPGTGDRIVTHIIKNSQEEIAIREESRFHEFAWGESVVRQVIDPAGAALITTTSYYEDPLESGSYGRIESRINPDGSWVRYVYDADGRKIQKITPWLNAPPGTSDTASKTTYYDYAPVSQDDNEDPDFHNSPRTVTEKILNQTVSRTFYVYKIEDGQSIEITEIAGSSTASYGDADNLRTTRIKYASGTLSASSGKTREITYPDGKKETFTYEYGTFTENPDPAACGFTAGAGQAIREIVVHGTVTAPDGIAFRTTRDVSISDEWGHSRIRENYVYNGSSYDLIEREVSYYDDNGRLTETYRPDGTFSSSTWLCCGKASDTDTRGIVHTYDYDDLQRLISSIKTGQGTQSDIRTRYTYDAAGRTLSETITGGTSSLTSRTAYDGAGRIATTTDHAGLVRTYSYSNEGLTTTIVQPGGATEITQKYPDGQIKSVTGTGVVDQYYEYGVNSDGSRWTMVYTGTPGSAMWEKSSVNVSGQVVSIEKSGYTGTEITSNYYNNKGQLIKTTSPGKAAVIYSYDAVGNQIRTGLDIDANGSLDPASSDRIEETDTSFVAEGGDYWRTTSQRLYAAENSSTHTTAATRKIRLTGLGVNNLVNEAISIDIHGNQTINRVFIDRSAKTETTITDFPDSAVNAVSVSENGLLKSRQSKSGDITTYTHDALGRQIGVTDPRTGTSITGYNNRTQVEFIEDAAHNRTTFAYDPATGRKVSETDALSRTTWFKYSNRGELTHTWGAVYPVKYEFNESGQMVKMHTYKTKEGWNTPVWPEQNNNLSDITTWHYDAATGLIESKEDAEGKKTSYTYTTGGKLLTRTWARSDGATPIVTTYGYNGSTGELTTIDYSDGTPDITFAYNRAGAQTTITDAVGTRQFTYNANLQQISENQTGIINTTLTRLYDTLGRASGISLNSGSYAVNYSYGQDGRFSGIAYNIGGIQNSANYGYLPGSDLIQSLTMGSGSAVSTTTYSYEPYRNLKTQITNKYNAALISQYDYTYDAIGRRTAMTTNGDLFSDQNPPAIPAQSSQTDYSSNALNQYTQINKDGQIADLTYDEDGNLEDDGKRILIYNGENRLVDIAPKTPVDGDKKLEFVYDYMGRRVKKSVYSYSSASSSWQLEKELMFVYDGWNLLEERTVASANQGSRYFVWGLDMSQSLQGAGGVGGLVAAVDQGNEYLYFYDANGNAGQMVKSSDGAVVAHYEYDPYGNVVRSFGEYVGVNPFGFSTKYRDGETGLIYYGYRYYSAELGRWISRDPIEEQGGANLYVFVLNNSIDSHEFLGLVVIYYDSYGKEIGRHKSLWPFVTKYIEGINGNHKFCNKNFWEVWDEENDYLPNQYNGQINENWEQQMKAFVYEQLNRDYIWEDPWWYVPHIMPLFASTVPMVLQNSPQNAPWDYKRHLSKEEWYIYNERAYVRDSIGNIVWGAIMKGFGWPVELSRKGAGAFQTRQDWRNNKFSWWQFITNIKNFGDDIRDSEAITLGYYL